MRLTILRPREDTAIIRSLSRRVSEGDVRIEGSLSFFVACDDKSEPVYGMTFAGLNFNLYRDGIRFPSSVASYVTVD